MRKRWKEMTPEERAAYRAYQEDLDRRILAKIEELRARVAQKQAAEGDS
jgi:hypothetical protein